MADNKKRSIKETLRACFGSLSYTPPDFLKKLREDKERRKGVKKAFLRVCIVTGGIMALLALLLFGGRSLWKKSQAEKIWLRYDVLEPSPPRNDDDPIQPLEIHFHGSAAAKDSVGKEVKEGISMKPASEGQWKWVDDRTLTFHPPFHWPAGQNQAVTLSKELFPRHIKVSPLQFKFSTVPLQMSMEDISFYIDPTDEKTKRVLATLEFNYPVDTSSVRDKIRIYPDLKEDSGNLVKKDYDFELNFGDENRVAYIVSEPVGVPLADVTMTIEVAKGIRDIQNNSVIKKKLAETLEISGISTFVEIKDVKIELVKDESQLYKRLIIVETKGDISSADLAQNMEVWELPKDRPNLPGFEGEEDAEWNDWELVTQEVLNLSAKVKNVPLPTELEYTSLNSFSIEGDSGKYLYVRIRSGTPFYGGYYLASDYETTLYVRDFPKELAFVSEGNVLPLSGSKRLSLFSRGVDKVHYRIHRILPDDINHLVSQSNGNIRNLRFKRRSFSIPNISKTYEGFTELNLTSTREMTYFSLDMAEYLATIPDERLRYGLFYIEVGEVEDYSFITRDHRLIIISDLGLLVKTSANGAKDLFIQSIATGRPIEGVRVKILGKNGIPLASQYSDAEGHAAFPSLDFSRAENQPTAFVAERGNDLSFLPYEAPGRFLDYSGFDTGGVYGGGDPGKLTAQVFSDRGIYRPGDRVNGAFIVKTRRWETSLAGTPLILIVSDSKGQVIYEEPISLSAGGFNEFSFETQDYSPTGEYQIDLYLVLEEERKLYLGGDTVAVEEFLPDRLKVAASFNRESSGWMAPEDLSGFVSVRNLYGTPASGSKVSARLRLKPALLNFRKYREYRFLQPEQELPSYDESLPDRYTDEEGKTAFPLALEKFQKGTYSLELSVEAYEKAGGRGVTSGAHTLVSPLKTLVGFKADGDLLYIRKGSERNVELIAVNPELNNVSLGGATLSRRRMEYITTLVKQPNGLYKYQSVEKEKVLDNTPLSIDEGGTILPLKTSQAGQYVMEIRDGKGNTLSRIAYTVMGESNLTRSLNRSAELEITLGKNDYKAGETVEVAINAPYRGAGLITIELDKVYAYKWFQSNSFSSIQTIEIPSEGLEGNAYVTVTYIRAPDSKEIFMSPLSYGSVPFSLDKEKRTQKIVLDYPGLIESGEELEIKYSSNKKGKIVIYAVDEGILQVGRYTLPDPLAYFFRKRALEVGTAQILDLILPEYSMVKQFSAPGGGMEAEMLAAGLNPFKRKGQQPVAFWSGILNSGPQTRSVRYRVPDYYNGSLVIMAVCVSEDAVGSIGQSALVRSTFVIQPSAPLAATGGDRFPIQATVANNLEGSGAGAEVLITLKGSEGLITPETSRTVVIPEGKDEVVSFPVEVGDSLGSKELIIMASSGGKSSSIAHSLSVRPAIPYRTELVSGVNKRGSEEIAVARDMYPEFRKLEVFASYLPMGLAGGLNYYLEEYPYTCSEQLISSAFPSLYDGFIKTLDIDRDEAEKRYSSTIAIMQARQKSDGGFGLWTVKSQSHPLIDLYAFHYLIEAKERGRYVPDSLFSRAADRAKELASSTDKTIDDMRIRAYAIFLLTHFGMTTTRYIEGIRTDLKREKIDWESDLVGVYLAASYSLLQMKSQAASILRVVRKDLKKGDFADIYNDRLSYLSQYLRVLSRYDKERLDQVSSELLDAMAGELEAQNYTTFSVSMALVALQAYIDVTGRIDDQAMRIAARLKDKTMENLVLTGDVLKTADFGPQAEEIRIENTSGQPLYYQVVQAGFDRQASGEERSEGLEILREFLDQNNKPVKKMELGKSYRVRISIRALEKGEIPSVAIVDLLPACLEPERDAIREDGNLIEGSLAFQADHVEIREDRLVIYGMVDENLAQYVYPVKAVYEGRFKVPPIFGEAMYDNQVWSLQGASELVVEE